MSCSDFLRIQTRISFNAPFQIQSTNIITIIKQLLSLLKKHKCLFNNYIGDFLRTN